MHKFNYKWYLKNGYPANGIEYHGRKVFGTFICGGGSTMGYKLSGYEHLGGVEIDKEVAKVYKDNHHPKYLYNEDIREFNKRDDLPDDLYNLDLLDGSPPCSTFSMAGNREKAWGKSKQFREGQVNQTLDDLVFVYCDTIIKLQPKVFLLENVKGIIQGNAKVYSKKIVSKMELAGYTVQVFCLNAASMGVPQKRERVFFIGHKNELKISKLKLEFNEKPILFGEIQGPLGKEISDNDKKIYNLKKQGDKDFAQILIRIGKKISLWDSKLIYKTEVLNTITSTSGAKLIEFDNPNHLSDIKLMQCGSYPLDYNFKAIEPKYLIGMSVPPVMTAQIAHKIYEQWLSKI